MTADAFAAWVQNFFVRASRDRSARISPMTFIGLTSISSASASALSSPNLIRAGAPLADLLLDRLTRLAEELGQFVIGAGAAVAPVPFRQLIQPAIRRVAHRSLQECARA